MKSYSNPVSVTWMHPTNKAMAFQWNKYNGRMYLIFAGDITPIDDPVCRFANSRRGAEARIRLAFGIFDED